MQLWDIELNDMLTLNDLNKISFGDLHHYEMDENGVFTTISNSSIAVKELCKITDILEEQDIEFEVDDKYNIKVNIFQ